MIEVLLKLALPRVDGGLMRAQTGKIGCLPLALVCCKLRGVALCVLRERSTPSLFDCIKKGLLPTQDVGVGAQ